MSEEIHPGSFVGDTVEEFKKLPLWGKVVVGAIGLVVVYLLYKKFTSGGGTSTSGTQPAMSPSGAQSPFPTVQSGGSSVPVIPSGVNPVYDQSGGLTAFQTAAPSAPAPTNLFATIRNAMSSGGTSAYDTAHPEGIPVRSTPGGAVTGSVGFGQTIQLANTPPVTGPSNFGANSTSGSTQWDQLSNGGYVSAYDVANTSQGGGAESWQSMLQRLKTYTPQRGDNMNEVSRKLGLNSWQDFNASGFEHGKPISIPRQ